MTAGAILNDWRDNIEMQMNLPIFRRSDNSGYNRGSDDSQGGTYPTEK